MKRRPLSRPQISLQLCSRSMIFSPGSTRSYKCCFGNIRNCHLLSFVIYIFLDFFIHTFSNSVLIWIWILLQHKNHFQPFRMKTQKHNFQNFYKGNTHVDIHLIYGIRRLLNSAQKHDRQPLHTFRACRWICLVSASIRRHCAYIFRILRICDRHYCTFCSYFYSI